MNDLFRNKFESFLKTSSNYFKNFPCDCLSKNGQMVSPIETSVSVRKWQVFGIRTIEQHRLTFFGTQHHKFRCNTRILNQACMLFSDSRLLENDVFHLQVQYLFQYGCYIFQTFLMCATGPYLFRNKKSFEYSLNWRISDGMYMMLHMGYHGGLTWPQRCGNFF